MRIIFDCDDVLLDWQGGFVRWLAKEHGLVPLTAAPDQWNMDAWLGRESLPLIQQFNQSRDFGRLAPFTDAASLLPLLNARNAEMWVVSSCGEGDAIERRMLNLFFEFGFAFREVICLPLGGSKRAALARLPKSIYVDDNVGHAETAATLGHRALVMNRSHNLSVETTLPRISNLFHVLLDSHADSLAG